jgi:hypothetical protein
MLFFILLLGALVRGLIFCALGASLALLMWVPCLVFRWPVPAFVRWGLATVVVTLHLYLNRIPVMTGHTLTDYYFAVAPNPADTTGWASTDVAGNVVVLGMAVILLACMGMVISLVKVLFKTLNRGGKALRARSTPSAPKNS